MNLFPRSAMIASLFALSASLAFTSYTEAQGRLEKIVSTIIHDDDSKTLSVRLLKERKMEQKTFSPRGVLKMKRLFRLDRQGKVQSGLAFDGVGTPIFKFVYEYDDLDRLSKERIDDMKGNTVRVMQTIYDETGKSKRVALTDVKPDSLKKQHKDILEHPERLENKGRKVSGDQTK